MYLEILLVVGAALIFVPNQKFYVEWNILIGAVGLACFFVCIVGLASVEPAGNILLVVAAVVAIASVFAWADKNWKLNRLYQKIIVVTVTPAAITAFV